MKNLSTLGLTLASLGLVAPSLAAQDLKFGLQATLSKPSSDLGDSLDNKLGYGAGAHLLIGLNGGHAIVPRLDYAYYENSDWDRKTQTVQLGVDYDYYFSGKVNQGLYAGVGAGYGAAKFEKHGTDDTPNAFHWGVNVGYQFTEHLGAELRFTSAKYEPEFGGVKDDVQSQAINASFVYRF